MPNDLSEYLAAFTRDPATLNRGLGRGAIAPLTGQPGLFSVGIEALYQDDLSSYHDPQLSAPESYLSGLEASPVLALDTGEELTLKAIQLFLRLSGYKGADGQPLSADGTWGKNSAFALAAWQQANSGKAGVSSLQIDIRRGRGWMASNIAGEMRAKLALNPQGRAELARSQPSKSAKPTAAAGGVLESVQTVRAILRGVGSPVPAQGLVDTALVQAWRSAASGFGLNPSVGAEVGAQQLYLDANTLSVMRVKARAGRTPSASAPRPANGGRPGTRHVPGASPAATSTGNVVATSGTLPVQTSEVQRVLRALGWTKSVQVDSKFGPLTKKAWESSATRRGIDPTILGQAGAGLVNVSSATLARLQQDAAMGGAKGSSTEVTQIKSASQVAPTPAPGQDPFVATPSTVAPPLAIAKPSQKSEEAPPRSGLAKVQVGTVQDVLLALKFSVGKAGRDGLWGKDTKAAWEKAAKNRGLDAMITRATPTEAWVSPQTLEQLSQESGGGVKKPGEPSPQPSAADKDLVAVELKSIGPIMGAFGKPQPKSGAELVASWKQIAQSQKLDDRAITKGSGNTLVLYAPKAAADALVKEAFIRLSLAKLIAASDTPVLMPTVQDAITFWSNMAPPKEKFGTTYEPKSRDLWDAATGVWMLRYLNIPRENIQIWERALPLLVAADKKSVKLPSSFVPTFGQNAANYQALKGKIVANKKEADKNASTEKKLQSAIDARDKAATSVVSVRLLQQALSELHARAAEGSIKLPKGVKVQAIARTGEWNAPTYDMTLLAYGDDLRGKMAERFMPDLIKALLSQSPPGAEGTSLNGPMRFLRVTPGVAKLISASAGKWHARTKEILDPSYVSGQVEKPVDPMKDPSNTRSSNTRSSNTRSSDITNVRNITNESNVVNERNVTNDTTRVEQPSQAGPDPVGPGPSEPEPISPAPADSEVLTPAPAPAPATSPGWWWALGIVGALGLGVAMSKKSGPSGAPMRPSRQ